MIDKRKICKMKIYKRTKKRSMLVKVYKVSIDTTEIKNPNKALTFETMGKCGAAAAAAFPNRC
jgi:hypothetical protein